MIGIWKKAGTKLSEKSCAVVIPVYKTENNLKKSEAASLLQCLKILGGHKIIFITSESLDISFYENSAKENGVECGVERFNDKFFKSINGYNSLLLRKMFYERFIDFEFILIYQLDAWVFEDKLEFWCQQNFDYIGAPWVEDYDDDNDESKPLLKEVGNGGFSLRKVSAFLEVLKPQFKFIRSFKDICKKNKKGRLISNILSIPLLVFKKFNLNNIIPSRLTTKNLAEDMFFAFYGRKFYPEFKTPPPEIALKFSFELQPARLFKMNDFKLPFGCHDFERRGQEFWKAYISI